MRYTDFITELGSEIFALVDDLWDEESPDTVSYGLDPDHPSQAIVSVETSRGRLEFCVYGPESPRAETLTQLRERIRLGLAQWRELNPVQRVSA